VSVPPEPAASARPTLRPGQRVRSTNDAPVFASDPKRGDQGIVGDVRGTNAHGIDTTSYLVRWASGLESWASADSIEPTRIGDPLPVGATPPVARHPAPPPLAWLGRRGTLHANRLIGIGVLLLTLLSFAPDAIRYLRHPSLSGKAWFVAIPIFIVVNALGVSRRRPSSKGPKKPDAERPAAR
jgi:hypothetical protein